MLNAVLEIIELGVHAYLDIKEIRMKIADSTNALLIPIVLQL